MAMQSPVDRHSNWYRLHFRAENKNKLIVLHVYLVKLRTNEYIEKGTTAITFLCGGTDRPHEID